MCRTHHKPMLPVFRLHEIRGLFWPSRKRSKFPGRRLTSIAFSCARCHPACWRRYHFHRQKRGFLQHSLSVFIPMIDHGKISATDGGLWVVAENDAHCTWEDVEPVLRKRVDEVAIDLVDALCARYTGWGHALLCHTPVGYIRPAC